jgi:hypothetical protein
MRLLIAIVLLISGGFSQTAGAQNENKTRGFKVELRAYPNPTPLTDDITVTVFFRSPKRQVTLWNAFGWGYSTGLFLQVLDPSGHEVKKFVQPYDVAPPDPTGKNTLISIGGDGFAGFDSHIPAKMLFRTPGKYTLKCIYSAPLPRDYFQGNTIWGKEDGPIESVEVPIWVK